MPSSSPWNYRTNSLTVNNIWNLCKQTGIIHNTLQWPWQLGIHRRVQISNFAMICVHKELKLLNAENAASNLSYLEIPTPCGQFIGIKVNSSEIVYRRSSVTGYEIYCHYSALQADKKCDATIINYPFNCNSSISLSLKCIFCLHYLMRLSQVYR